MWINPKEQTPLAWEEGNWDGKKSDNVLAITHYGRPFIARVYEGTLDGEKFLDWYDDDDTLHERGVLCWMKIPEWP